jgi:type II secretory pathway pseudopilin PulG
MKGKFWLTQALATAAGQRGLGLVETLVAVAILGTTVVAFATSLSAGSIAVRDQDEITVTQGLAQTQLEYTKSYTYNPGATTYPLVAAPTGYTIAVGVSAVPGADTNIQKITVTVSRDGQAVETVQGYKDNR